MITGKKQQNSEPNCTKSVTITIIFFGQIGLINYKARQLLCCDRTEYTQVDKFWSKRFLIAHIYLTWRVRLQRQTWPPALVQEKTLRGRGK
jgi:hypothetical protein